MKKGQNLYGNIGPKRRNGGHDGAGRIEALFETVLRQYSTLEKSVSPLAGARPGGVNRTHIRYGYS